jgi:plasmid stabilization system protein ParE
VTRQITLRPQFEIDVAEAASWYEGQRAGLGKEFLRCVDESVDAIAALPLGFRKVHKETRRIPVGRFPYGLLYRVTEDEIVLTACMHSRRHSQHWLGRR